MYKTLAITEKTRINYSNFRLRLHSMALKAFIRPVLINEKRIIDYSRRPNTNRKIQSRTIGAKPQTELRLVVVWGKGV